jgi:hypothetical protein
MAQKMQIFITSAYEDPDPKSFFLKAYDNAKQKEFELTNDPSMADLILFVENSRYHSGFFFQKLKKSPLIKQFPDKTYMYNPHDHPWFVLPGLYPSVPLALFNRSFIAAVPYIESINNFIYYDSSVPSKYLFSFVGNPNSSPRKKILKITHPRGLVKGTPQNMFGSISQNDSKVDYANIMNQSKFVLCPRGAGTSSFRIFEAMQAGRVPVIISDNWVRPIGPEWDKFAIFIAERSIKNIPQILLEEEVFWDLKSKIAREAWESYFSSENIFNYMINSLLNLDKKKIDPFYGIVNGFFFSRYFFRKHVIERVKGYLR